MDRKIAYSCFVDAKPKFESEVVRWLWSLVEKLKVQPCDIYVTCASNVSAELVDTLGCFDGLNIAYETCFTDISPPANKWLQLKKLCEVADRYTHFMLTDCDKVFVEFSEDWCDDSVRACAFIPRPTYAIFENIFQTYFKSKPRFIIQRPDPQDENRDNRNYVNNHNGGLIIIPASKIKLVTEKWKFWIDQLLSNTQLLRSNIRNLDQVAMSLAMHDIGSDINFLPPSLDLGPNITDTSTHFLEPGSGQLILHIHGFDDDEGRIVCDDRVPEEFKAVVGQVNDEFIAWKTRAVTKAA